MSRFQLFTLDNSFLSYCILADLFYVSSGLERQTVELRITDFASGNMCAILGLLASQLEAIGSVLSITSNRYPVVRTLVGNGFLRQHKREHTSREDNRAISYRKLRPADSKYFNLLFAQDLASAHAAAGSPMGDDLLLAIRLSTAELFANTQQHSQATWVHSCGLFFPEKGRFEFTLADDGVGIHSSLGGELSTPENHSDWLLEALRQGATSRKDLPGGIGLPLILQLLGLNHGKLQMVSGHGFLHWDTSGFQLATLPHPFPGTVITLQLNSQDRTRYSRLIQKTLKAQ